MFRGFRHHHPVRVSLLCCGLILGICPLPVLAGEGFPTLPTDHPSQAALEAAFDQAGADFGVPAEILKAVAFVESRWVQAGPTIDGGWGIMHLVDNEYSNTLQEAAALSSYDLDTLKSDAVANIRGGAALIADKVRTTVGSAESLADYRPALKAFTGLLPSVQDKQMAEYYRVLAKGAQGVNPLGMKIDLAPSTLPAGEQAAVEPQSDNVVMSTDYPPALWVAAHKNNYSTGRGGTAIDRWINHWIGSGTYAGAISWFQDPTSNVSAHFVVRQSDGELTQMVRIANTAYHAGNWNYNQRSIGIEHEATPSNPWPTSSTAPMLVVSTDCCRYFCNLYGIPKTRSYIIGHQEVPGVATDCPGPLPWDIYMALVNNTSPPTILQQPSAQTICPGSEATFSVQAIGGTLSYRWQKNSSNITDGGHYSGTATDTLTVSNADSADAANYRCVVTNSYGSTTSNNAALTLRAATIITQQPQPQQVDLGGTATFSVTATGDGTPSYQWRRNDVNMSNDGRITGATTATLRITNVNAGDVAGYSCAVTAGCGSATSNRASLRLPGIPGDFDGDNDVDLEDFGVFQRCLSGTNVPQEDPACARAHLQGDDADVDYLDLAKFLGCITGANIPGDVNCAN